MNNGNLEFTPVPNKDGSLYHHLVVGSFPANFGSPYVLRTFKLGDEEFGRPMEVLDFFEIEMVNFSCVIFHIQGRWGLSHWVFWSPQCC